MSGDPGARRRVPTILQLEATECGAAALAMVMAGFGRWIGMDEMRLACGISRDGSKALSLLKAARGWGMTAKGWRYTAVASLRPLPKPCIVFVDANHFLVLEGFEGDRVHLNDPALGRRRVSEAEFQAMFSGIALTFEPGPDFRPGGSPRSTLRMVAGWLAEGRDAAALAVAAGALLVLPGLAVPAFLRVFTDDYLIEGQQGWVGWMLLLMLATVLVQGGLAWLRGWALGRLRTLLALRAGARFAQRMLRLPMLFYLQRYPGSISSRVDGTEALATHAAGDALLLAVEPVALLLFAALMLAYQPALAALVLLFALGSLAAFLLAQRFLEEGGQRTSALANKLAAATMQGISMIEPMKAAGAENQFFARWAGHFAQLYNARQTLGRGQAVLAVVPDFLAALSTMAVLVAGGWLAMRGQISLGLLVAFQLLQASFMASVHSLLHAAVSFRSVRGVLDQLHDVLDAPEAPEFAARPEAAPPPTPPLGLPGMLDGSLRARGLRFGYSPTEAPLLDGFDLDVAPGAWIALVGGSGSGKSTVGRLLCGLFEPWAGEVRCQGRPLSQWPRAVLRDSVAVIDQEIVLFEGSIRDNLTLWDPTVPDSALVRAARDACIHDDILLRPGGYDAPVAERGRNFSGGQCQRLEIARALLRGPTLLVLDEATSALDAEVEQRILANLRRRGCTCIVIAHRLSTIRDCDEILVLERGRVLERGTHDSLVARDGPYRRLVET